MYGSIHFCTFVSTLEINKKSFADIVYKNKKMGIAGQEFFHLLIYVNKNYTFILKDMV